MQGDSRMLQQGERREWMGLLARAPLALLETWAARQPQRRTTWLRRPETGLVMVRARAGGTGAQFNLGEMTITRCALRLEGAGAGVAYVQGRSPRKAEIAALADALLQGPGRDTVRRELLDPLRARLESEAARVRRRAQSTKVAFFTLARETGE
jgi:alpha-D-ribose 1-methylphosphonate 5-triphosphate synthase subunit PhnG